MQFIDLTNQIKDGVIMHLSGYGRLTQVLPVEQIFAMQVPANTQYPYVRFRDPISTPYETSCWLGTTCRFTLDAYAEGSSLIPAGETEVIFVKSLIVEAMNSLQIEGLGIVQNEYLGAREVMVADEADRWRSMIEYNVTATVPVA